MSDFVEEEQYDWSDITPIPQDDGPDPVVRIAYAPEFTKWMDIFRAIMLINEYSPRVLHLTDLLLELNPASYTVWQYRRACLVALNSDLNKELDFMDEFASENPKNYQIWHHRRAIVELLGNGSRELSFCEAVFDSDSKNYHAWAHRQWVIKTFGYWNNELEFVENVIEDDIRNNSAWNQRWFVVHFGPIPITQEIINREVIYTLTSIEKVKRNESAWNYLRGLINYHPEIIATVIAKLESWLADDSSSSEYRNHLSLALFADLKQQEVNNVESLTLARKLFKELVDMDSIRAKSYVRNIMTIDALLAVKPLPCA